MKSLEGLTPEETRNRLTDSCCSQCKKNPLMEGHKCSKEFRNSGCLIVLQYLEKNMPKK